MFSTIIFRLVRQALSGALLLISACLMMSVTQSLAQTDTTKQGAERILSDSLTRESVKIYQKWSRTRNASDTVSLNRALNIARQSIQADTAFSWAYWNISYVLNAMDKRKEAIAAAEKAAELDGKPQAFLGRLYFLDGQRDKALETFKNVILLSPSDYNFFLEVRSYLGECDFSPEEIKGVLSLYDPTKIEKPEVLERSASLYQSLKGYRDTTTVEMRIIRPGMDNRTTAPSLFAFQRPNRFRIESRNAPEGMEAALFDDGTKIVSYNEMWKQYKQEDAPETLTTADQQGRAVGLLEIAFVPKMILSDNPLKELLGGAEKAELIGSENLDGTTVTVVELTKQSGSLPGYNPGLKNDVLVGLRMWIGSEDFLIRQMAFELDLGKMVGEGIPQQQQAMMKGMKMSFSIKHSAIEINPLFTDKYFAFTPPEGARLVEEFIPPAILEKFGKPAPGFVLKDLEGQEVKLADFAGKVIIIDFWATWCPPCVKEIPEFVELYEANKDKGLVIVGISLDQGGVEVVKKFAAEHKVNYPLIMGDKKVDEAYGGITGIPTTFVLDRKGNIVDGVVGGRPKSYFEKKISSLF